MRSTKADSNFRRVDHFDLAFGSSLMVFGPYLISVSQFG